MYMILLYIFLLNVCFGFDMNLASKRVLFFPLQINYNDPLPVDLYTSFVNKLVDSGYDVRKSAGNIEEDCEVVKDFSATSDNTVTLVAHSTGVNNLLKVLNEVNVDNVVLVDPILLKNAADNFKFGEDWEDTISEFIESNKFDLMKNTVFKKDVSNKPLCFENTSNITYLSSKKSARWKLIPPVAPMKKFFMDYGIIKNKNKTLVTIPDFGHFDILDRRWADAIHNSISKGTKIRDDIFKYHEKIVEVIDSQ